MATVMVAISFIKRIMKSRKTNRALMVIAAVCLVFIAGYFLLDTIIKKKIRQQFNDLSPALHIKYSRLHTNLFSSSVSFDSLVIYFTPYNGSQQNQHELFFSEASLKGISFLKFLFNKKLDATTLLLDKGNIHLDSFLLVKKDSAQSEIFHQIKWPFKKFSISNIKLRRSEIFLRSQNNNRLLTNAEMFFDKVSMNQFGKDPAFENLSIRLFDLNYSLAEYNIQAKQLLIDSRKKIIKADSLRLNVKNQEQAAISSLTMSGFNVMKFINEKVLSANKIIIGESKISLIQTERSNNSPLAISLKKVHIDHLQLLSSFVSYKDKTNECRFSAALNMEQIDADSSLDIKNFHFANVQANLSDIHYSGNNYHRADIKSIEINSKNQLIKAEGINVTPILSKYEFQKKLNYQADWMQAHVSRIDILKSDLHKLFQKKLFAAEVKIGESKAYIFRDRRLPRQEKNILLPIDYLKTLPVDIRIKSCELAASTVVYEEFPKAGYGITGILKIEKINLTLSPLINHPLPSDPLHITISVEGSIMGSGTTHASVLMPLQNNKPYYVKGSIEKLELTKLNSSSENLGKIRIKSGFLDFLSFDFTMTKQRSTGKIIGAYHHLIIQQLKKHTEEKNVADFASFALKHAIIPLNKDQSLPERKRTGKVDYQRDYSRMFSYYFLQSLLTGVKKSFTLGFLLPK
jgi:hypothetical protein